MVVVSMLDGTHHAPIRSTTKVNKPKVSVHVIVKQKLGVTLKQEAIVVSSGPVYILFDERVKENNRIEDVKL